MRTLLKNCYVVNHDGVEKGDILIENDRITDTKAKEAAADITHDCEGLYALPGLIDMHTHMREPGYEYKEDIATASAAAAAGGVTTACCMANTKPAADNAAVIAHITAKGREAGLIDVLPYGAVTKGIKGEELTEMGDMLAAGACALSDDGRTIMNAEVMRRALEYAGYFGSFVASHAIDLNLQGDGVIHEGEVSAVTGLKGIPSASESSVAARDILLAQLTKSRVHICHISAKETVELLRWAKERGINVTGEATPHHFSLTEKACLHYDTNCKMSPPLRSEEDRQSIIEGLKDGVIDCVATDHAPHQEDEKFAEFDYAPVGIIGLQTLIPLTLRLISDGMIDWPDFARIASYNPAKILGKKDLGRLEKGMKADIVLIDPDAEYVFDEKINKSKSKNSPWWNKTLKGRAARTIKNGNTIFTI